MKHLKILLVDDEQRFVEALAERLEIRGFDVLVALTGKRAVDIVRDEDFDGMVLDLNLPDLHGTEVLRVVRALKPEIKVHILTGHGGDDDRRECMGLGAVSFINKPINAQSLAETLRGGEEPS